MLSQTLSASPSPPRALPLKFRRKSLTASDVDPLDVPFSSQSPSHSSAYSPPHSASYSSSSYRGYPYSSACDSSSVSASSSPFAPSVVLASSPTERAHIRYQSSPIHAPSSDYVICARDVRDEESAYTHPSVYPSAKYAHAGYAPARLPPPARSAYGYGCTVMSDALEPPSTSDIDLDVSDDGDETFRGVDNGELTIFSRMYSRGSRGRHGPCISASLRRGSEPMTFAGLAERHGIWISSVQPAK